MTGVQQVINLSKLIGDFIEQLAEIKPFTVYVVAESNHGQVRSLASSRSEFPKDDLGYVFGEWLTKVAPSNVKVNVAGVIETKNEIKFHGHQSFAKNKHSVQQYYGKDKNIEMGHFHKFMVEQIEDNRFVVKYPTAKNKVYEYEIQNAYVNNPPKIVKKEKGINDIIKSFKVIDIK